MKMRQNDMKNLKITLISLTFILSLVFVSCNTQKQKEKNQTKTENKSDDQVLKNYLSKKESITESFSRYFYSNYKKINSLGETDFLQVLDSLRKISTDNFEYLQNNTDSDKAFLFKESKDIEYFYDKFLVEYPYFHERFTGNKPISNKLIKQRLDSHLQEFNNSELLKIESFRNYIKAFLYMQSKIELKKSIYKNTDNQQLNATLNLIADYFKNKEVVDYLKYEYLNNHIENIGIKNIGKIYSDFVSTCSDYTYLNKIKSLYEQDKKGREGHLIKTYKTVNGCNLEIHLFLPKENMQNKKVPAIVYFSGGSWTEGKPDWNFSACKSYAEKGWVGVTVEYRLGDRQGILPFEAVMDAKSAIRWLREHSGEFNIDVNKIVASGNSAGGHLILATALVENWNEKSDNLKYSCVPNVLMVNSGVYDLTDENTLWIRRDLKNRNQSESLVKEISPIYLIKKDFPPTLIIHGTNDRNVPFHSAKQFSENMSNKGNEIEFYPIEGAGHFIWWGQYSQQVSEKRSVFLEKLGY